MTVKERLEQYRPYNEQERKDKDVILQCMNLYENVFYRDNLIVHFTSSSWIMNPCRTKVIMVHHNIMDRWVWPGGHADGNENLLQVAVKEAKEETGLKNLKVVSDDIFSIDVLPVASHVKHGMYVNSHLHLNVSYLFEASESEKLEIKVDENSAVKWIERERLPKLVKQMEDFKLYQKVNEKCYGF